MDSNQFGEFMAIIKSAYPRENLFGIESVKDVWFRLLKDIDGRIIKLAAMKWVSTQKWPPSIAEIRLACVDIQEGTDDDWSKKWEQVLKLIAKYGYYRSNEAFSEMDDLTSQVVKRIGYINLCKSENLGIDRAAFRDIYLSLAKRKKEDAQMPEQLRLVIDKMQNLQIGTEERKQLEGEGNT